MATKQSGIILLHRDSFQVYSPYLTTILEFRFVPEIIRDLDVINKDLLENLIKLFITNSKIPPSNMQLVIADNAAFIKDFAASAPPSPQPGVTPVSSQNFIDELKVEADKFTEHVPFENVVSKTFPWNNGLRVFAVNQELYEDIKNSFEKNGFTIDVVIPGFLLGNLSISPTIDIGLAATLPEKINGLRQNNLLTKAIREDETQDSDEQEQDTGEHKPPVEMRMPQGKDKKRLYVMVGVFVVLIIILIIVYFQSLTPPPVMTNTSTVQQPVTAVQPATTNNVQTTPIVQSVATVIPSLVVAKELTVQIVSIPVSVRSAQTLKTRLDTFGFKSVQIQNQTTTGASKSLITFSSRPSPAVKNSLLEEVRKIAADVTVQENKENSIDIAVFLAK